MYIIKLNAIGSTNAYLKEMASVALPKDFTVVISDIQTEGRGQIGTKWQSEEGKNLTVSVFKRIRALRIDEQFYISMAVSLAICKALRKFHLPKLKIKWPNDILSANKKICGVLIENVIKNNTNMGSIIGFGLNVNQKYFDNLPNASSLHLLTGRVFDKDELLSEILKQFETYFQVLEKDNLVGLRQEYHSRLFRINKPSTFRLQSGETFSGIIKGVTKSGQLMVWLEDEIVKTFEFKELALLY